MIFVTVGTHSQGFDRLIKKMDEIASKINEEVIMQIGATKYHPVHAKFFDYIDDFEIKEFIRRAKVVICHAGAGTIITALEQGTPVIVVPRLKKYKEVLNDHQLELADALAAENKITIVYDLENLEPLLSGVFKKSLILFQKNEQLIKSIKNYINTLPQ
jgi:beta-1,4-N-acetylglucosaminyltransferase